jgi:P-type Cu2+ transporter
MDRDPADRPGLKQAELRDAAHEGPHGSHDDGHKGPVEEHDAREHAHEAEGPAPTDGHAAMDHAAMGHGAPADGAMDHSTMDHGGGGHHDHHAMMVEDFRRRVDVPRRGLGADRAGGRRVGLRRLAVPDRRPR